MPNRQGTTRGALDERLSWAAVVRKRYAERVRPWAAPVPAADAPEVVIVGAGPAGLATAALLRRGGVRAIVVDRADRVGSSWAGRYDSLRLNTVRWMSDLPGLRMDRSLGRWVGRDDLVAYLERYAAHHRRGRRRRAPSGPSSPAMVTRTSNSKWRQ